MSGGDNVWPSECDFTTETRTRQAAMGSDPKREALSLAYAALGQIGPVLLYSRKEEVALYVPILTKQLV
jgi:hypothetical protein